MKAAADGISGVNAAMAYATDGALKALDLHALEDTRHAEPVYAPAPVIRQATLAAYPEITGLLEPVFAKLDLATLRDLNEKVAVEGEDPGVVAREFFRAQGLLAISLTLRLPIRSRKVPRCRKCTTASSYALCSRLCRGFFRGFLNFAPNRLARGVAYALFQAPILEATVAIDGALRIDALQSCPGPQTPVLRNAPRGGIDPLGEPQRALAISRRFLMERGPPAARASLGPAFWTLASVAILAIVDAVQRGNFGFLASAGVGAAVCAGFFLMAAAGEFDHLSLAREYFEQPGDVRNRALAPSRPCRRGDAPGSDHRGAAHLAHFAQEGLGGFCLCGPWHRANDSVDRALRGVDRADVEIERRAAFSARTWRSMEPARRPRSLP